MCGVSDPLNHGTYHRPNILNLSFVGIFTLAICLFTQNLNLPVFFFSSHIMSLSSLIRSTYVMCDIPFVIVDTWLFTQYACIRQYLSDNIEAPQCFKNKMDFYHEINQIAEDTHKKWHMPRISPLTVVNHFGYGARCLSSSETNAWNLSHFRIAFEANNNTNKRKTQASCSRAEKMLFSTRRKVACCSPSNMEFVRKF